MKKKKKKKDQKKPTNFKKIQMFWCVTLALREVTSFAHILLWL